MAIAVPSQGAPGRWTLWLVSATVFATAFNDLAAILPAGELASDGFIYVFPLLFLALLRRPGEIRAPVALLVTMLAMFVVLVAGVVANWDDIGGVWFKGRSGLDRVITQGMAVGFGFAIALAFYNLALRGALPWIARAARWAILAMAAMGCLEIASWGGVPGLTQAHDALASVVHANSGWPYVQRLRMTAFEVSWAAVILTFLFPFAILDLPIRGWRFRGLVLLVFVMVALAQSRTGLLVIGLQGALLAGLVLARRVDLLVRGGAVLCCLAMGALLVPGLGDRLAEPLSTLIERGSLSAPDGAGAEENVSNVTRLAAIRAGLSMFAKSPVLGIGLGQYGFAYPGEVRAEDYRSWEVRDYVAGGEELWPPSYSIHVRLLAETGVLGYGLWLAILLPLLARAVLGASVSDPGGRVHLAVAMTLLGWFLLGVSIDSFRFFGGWIAVGIGYATQARAAAGPGDARAAIGTAR